MFKPFYAVLRFVKNFSRLSFFYIWAIVSFAVISLQSIIFVEPGMSLKSSCWMFCLLASVFLCRLHASSGVFSVSAGFDQESFEYKLDELEQRELHTVYKISFPSPLKSKLESNNTVYGEFFLPRNIPENYRCPAVLVNHILHGNFDLERMMCTSLANQGLAAMFIMLPYYGERGGGKARTQALENADKFIESLQQGILDNRRAVDLLCSRSDIDPARIGVAGGSLGAIMSATVCGYEPRIERAFLLLGGGNLEKIFAHPARETKAFRDFLARLNPEQRQETLAELRKIDPLTQAEALRRLSTQGKLKMICAAEDEVIPPSCSSELAEAAGCEIIWLPGVGHYTVASQSAFAFAELIDFFSQNPALSWQPKAGEAAVDLETRGIRLLGNFFRDLHLFLSDSAIGEQAQHLSMDLAFSYKGQSYQSQLSYANGTAGKYKLFIDVPKLGQGWIGQGEQPWMLGAKQSLYVGSLDSQPGRRAGDYISAEQMMKFQLAQGVLASAGLAPEMLKSFGTFRVSAGDQGGVRINIDIKYNKFKGLLYLMFDKDGKPDSAVFNSKEAQLSCKFKDWRLRETTSAGLFEPPAGSQAQEVRQEDMLRMIAAVFERLLETIEY